MGVQGVRTDAWRDPFLRLFSEMGVVYRAAEAANIHRSEVYRTIHEDPAFAAAFEDARRTFVERAEAEVYRRGIEGYDEPVYQGGERVGVVRKYSDVLLMATLNANDPAKWRRTTRVEQTGPGGGPIQIAEGMSDHERVALKAAIETELARREQPA